MVLATNLIKKKIQKIEKKHPKKSEYNTNIIHLE